MIGILLVKNQENPFRTIDHNALQQWLQRVAEHQNKEFQRWLPKGTQFAGVVLLDVDQLLREKMLQIPGGDVAQMVFSAGLTPILFGQFVKS